MAIGVKIKEFLDEARNSRRYILGWNTVFDISRLLAFELEENAST